MMKTKRYRLQELYPGREALTLPSAVKAGGNRVHIVALGDVGLSLALGLRLLGGKAVEIIGLFDPSEKAMKRCEMELNQIGPPILSEEGMEPMPEVILLKEEELFCCDVFVFCASKSVPALGVEGDVRMMQFAANRPIVEYYGRLAARAGYQGIFAVVSDPVDPLCKAALQASGLRSGQIRGYGLGVMNKRAEYYARKEPRFAGYLKEGRAFGPHGSDLVIANSLEHYDDSLSRELTCLAVEANLRVRELGFKPYLAPAMSSGALSILLTVKGQWHYSSIFFGREGEGAFLGVRNRITGKTVQYEDLPLPPLLFERIATAYKNLAAL